METSDPKYKHKPSEKHTLEEVLKSLQDMIRNDLAEGAAGAAKAGSAPVESRQQEGASPGTAEPSPRRDSTSSLREDFAPVAPGSGPVNLDAVMRSLKDLIGNELNVGDEPKPPEAKSAETHEEYLATEEKIEEYIPEELGRLGDEPNIAGERVPNEPEPAPLRDESFAPEEIIEETLPRGFTPLDEELTLEELADATPSAPDLPEEIFIEETLPEGFDSLDEEPTAEKPAEITPPAPALPETPELPGEISPELALEPELKPPPSAPEAPPAMDAGIAPGTQQEMFLEEPPPIELRMPPPAAKTAPAPEPAPEPETAATPAVGAPEMELGKSNTEPALPTIEVEESFDAGNYFDTVEPPAENPPAVSEEHIVLDVKFADASETMPPAVEPPPATPTDTTLAPEPPAAPVEKKVTLEIVSGPLLDDSQSRSSVDFDALNLEPPPPAATASPAPEDELPVIAVEPDLNPATEPETPKPAETAPVAETTGETAPTAETTPSAPDKSGAPQAPSTFNLDDIPVLNEVVAPPAGSVPAAKPDTPPSTLPAPDRARDLVVRAVAKLNVEMRKTGGAGLDTKTILRLQQLIRQELEKDREK